MAFSTRKLMWIGAATALVFTSCRKEEAALEPVLTETVNLNDIYGTQTAEVAMGSDYRYQAYFDFSTGTHRGTIDKFSFDWALNHATGQLELNSAISGLRMARSTETWENTTTSDNLSFDYDLQTGLAEDLCIGSDLHGVLVLDRGVNALGESRGFRKLAVEFSDGNFSLNSAELDGSDLQQFTLPTTQTHTFTYVDVQAGAVEVAPRKDEWDVVFTHYLHVYDPETEPFPYMVSGVLLNPEAVWVAEVEEVPYAEVDWATTETLTFTNQRDRIGFDWKYFDFDLGYIVDQERVFVIEDGAGERFKMHFTGFLNDQGEKGYPQFTFQRLKP